MNVYDLYGDITIDLDKVELFKATDVEKLRYSAETGDVFFTRSSLKPEGVAWTAYLEHVEEPIVFECHLIRAKVNKEQILPAYFSNYCRTTLARKYLMARASITTMATIDQPAVMELPVILPSMPVQKKMVEEIQQVRDFGA